MRLLILGGTTEASALARRLAGRRDVWPMLSLAGRTRGPVPPPIPFRVGGFGGVPGLRDFLMQERIDGVVDATHPFAARMSSNAVTACGDLGMAIARFTRPAWREQSGDRWTGVPDIDFAVQALGVSARRVFLTIGGQQLEAFAVAPWHHYIARTIDRPEAIDLLPSHQFEILARGPFSLADEIGLMREERVEVLVTKNSGGAATEAKLAAARALGLEVVMIARPAEETVEMLGSVDAVLAWIEAHRTSP